jgi:hypothetical protein
MSYLLDIWSKCKKSEIEGSAIIWIDRMQKIGDRGICNYMDRQMINFIPLACPNYVKIRHLAGDRSFVVVLMTLYIRILSRVGAIDCDRDRC